MSLMRFPLSVDPNRFASSEHKNVVFWGTSLDLSRRAGTRLASQGWKNLWLDRDTRHRLPVTVDWELSQTAYDLALYILCVTTSFVGLEGIDAQLWMFLSGSRAFVETSLKSLLALAAYLFGPAVFTFQWSSLCFDSGTHGICPNVPDFKLSGFCCAFAETRIHTGIRCKRHARKTYKWMENSNRGVIHVWVGYFLREWPQQSDDYPDSYVIGEFSWLRTLRGTKLFVFLKA